MPEPDFQHLQSDLLQAGIAARHVRRTVSELREHLDDLIDADIATGTPPDIAQQNASRQMGDLQEVAVVMRACPELRSWSYRYPRIAVLAYPLTCLLLLPVVPVIAGVAHAPQVARWGACVLFGGVVTAAIFLLLQLSITLT